MRAGEDVAKKGAETGNEKANVLALDARFIDGGIAFLCVERDVGLGGESFLQVVDRAQVRGCGQLLGGPVAGEERWAVGLRGQRGQGGRGFSIFRSRSVSERNDLSN